MQIKFFQLTYFSSLSFTKHPSAGVRITIGVPQTALLPVGYEPLLCDYISLLPINSQYIVVSGVYIVGPPMSRLRELAGTHPMKSPS